MAIPFCFDHEVEWRAGCDGCDRARPVRVMLDAHRELFPMCDMWPLCNCEAEAACDSNLL